jgi:hypothetical protein
MAGPDPLLWGNVFTPEEVLKITAWVVARKKKEIEKKTGEKIDVKMIKKSAGIEDEKKHGAKTRHHLKNCKIQ